ncbi:MAG: hypothetical protein ABIH63_03225 [archaeon]
MVRIREVAITTRKEYRYDLPHLIKKGDIKELGNRDFHAKGFQGKSKNKVLSSIAKAAETLESNLVIIERERSTKRGVYKANVTFYRDSVDLKKMPEDYMFHV